MQPVMRSRRCRARRAAIDSADDDRDMNIEDKFRQKLPCFSSWQIRDERIIRALHYVKAPLDFVSRGNAYKANIDADMLFMLTIY